MIFKVWKVKKLGQDISSLEKDVIYIDGMRFKETTNLMLRTGYTRGGACSEGTKYPHRSIQGVAIIVNKEAQSLKVEYTSDSGLSAVINDLNLPAYNRS